MAIALAIILGLLALAFVLYPVYRQRHEEPSVQIATIDISLEAKDANSATKASALLSLAEKEQSARSALQEVELDYQLGNLEETDYRSLRTRYMRRAALALKSRREREQELGAMIEEKLRLLKEQNEHEVE